MQTGKDGKGSKQLACVQVALMFLVKGPIPTEPIWTAFIASAAELELRKRVPPTRPAFPELFPEVDRVESEVNANCWSHGGIAVPLGVPPRPQYTGGLLYVDLHVDLWLCAALLSIVPPGPNRRGGVIKTQCVNDFKESILGG
jgi:hypothetical protein